MIIGLPVKRQSNIKMIPLFTCLVYLILLLTMEINFQPKFAEGAPISGRNICIVEDIVTTGGQIIKSAKMLREAGAKVDFVLCAIQRKDDATEILSKEGLTLIPYMTMEYIKEQIGIS